MLCTFQSSADVSFPAMQQYMQQVVKILNDDPAVANAVGFTGSGQDVSTSTNVGRLYVSLRPLSERRIGVDDVIARLRNKMQRLVGHGLLPITPRCEDRWPKQPRHLPVHASEQR